jgi:hypothetical protein
VVVYTREGLLKGTEASRDRQRQAEAGRDRQRQAKACIGRHRQAEAGVELVLQESHKMCHKVPAGVCIGTSLHPPDHPARAAQPSASCSGTTVELQWCYSCGGVCTVVFATVVLQSYA